MNDNTLTTAVQSAPLPLEYKPERFARFLGGLGFEARYNVRSQTNQWRYVPDVAAGEKLPKGWDSQYGWRDLTDVDAQQLRKRLADMRVTPILRDGPFRAVGMCLELPQNKFLDAFSTAAALNPVDPLLEYLENDTYQWDGESRLDLWLEECFDVDAGSLGLAHWASTFIFLGAVWRAYHPGMKLDEMPVLIGPGGIGKSTALQQCLPPNLQGMFADGLNLAASPKERVEALQGRAIVEIGEMQGARRADMESLKAFLSRTDDGSTRLAYRRNPEPMPRRCIVVGTADRPDPLPDDHNLRRFVPVTLNGGNAAKVVEYMAKNRDQLWAEAMVLYEDGFKAYLPEKLKPQQQEATERARSTDTILESKVADWLTDAPEYFELERVAYAVGMVDEWAKTVQLTQGDIRRLSAVLRHHGYQPIQHRRDGRKVREWYCPN